MAEGLVEVEYKTLRNRFKIGIFENPGSTEDIEIMAKFMIESNEGQSRSEFTFKRGELVQLNYLICEYLERLDKKHGIDPKGNS